MFLASTSVAGGATASAAYRSQNLLPMRQSIGVTSPVISLQAAKNTGLSAGRRSAVSAAVPRQFGSGLASTQTAPADAGRTIVI